MRRFDVCLILIDNWC